MARALAMKPEVLLLRITDPRSEVEKAITQQQQAGQTMILVSHDESFVSQVGLVPRQGKLNLGHQKKYETLKSGQEEFFAGTKRTFV